MWLHNKIAAAQTAVEAFDAGGATPPPADLSRKILNSVVVKSITIETPAGRRELVLPGFSPDAAEPITADDSSYFESIEATFHALFASPGRIVKLSAPVATGPGGDRGDVRRDAPDREFVARLA